MKKSAALWLFEACLGFFSGRALYGLNVWKSDSICSSFLTQTSRTFGVVDEIIHFGYLSPCLNMLIKFPLPSIFAFSLTNL